MQGLTTANVKNGGAIIDTNGFDVTIAQPLVHFAAATTDSLTKSGAGNLTLTGNNTYSGATTVNVGTLIVSGGGTINPSSQVAVAGGATLTHDAAAALTAPLSLAENSTISGAGVFTTTNLTIVGDLTGGTFSAINSPATFAPSGSLAFTLTNTVEGTYDLFFTNPASFSFTSVSVGALPLVDSGGTFSANDGSFAYTFVNGADVLQIAAIPEPGTWVLVGIGLTFLLYRRRNSRSEY
jgi:autotransporter-associated beta strand protein